MKLTAKDLLELNVIDKIIPEKIGNIEEAFIETSDYLKKEILNTLKEFKKIDTDEIVEQRYDKFRNMGEVIYL